MSEDQPGDELNYNARCREDPVGNHHMARGEVYARNILSAVGHEQIKRTTDARTEKNR